MFASGNIHQHDGWFGIALIVFAFGLGAYLFVNTAFQDISSHTIKSVELVNNVHGSDGDIWTSVYYVVVTDKGIYHLKTDGINAAPGIVGKIEEKKGQVCTLETRGIHIPFFGIYKSIINIF